MARRAVGFGLFASSCSHLGSARMLGTSAMLNALISLNTLHSYHNLVQLDHASRDDLSNHRTVHVTIALGDSS